MISPDNVIPDGISRRRGGGLQAIVAGGLTAGALDITYAFIIWALRGVAPIRILQSISAGLLGREAALAGGLWTGALGLLLHFAITLVMATFYYAAATRIRLLVERAPACGIAYGLGLYAVMNYVVLPLSAIGRGGGAPVYAVITDVLSHMFFVGLPIALFTRRGLRAG